MFLDTVVNALRPELSGIYAIVDRSATDDPFGLLAAVLAGGVRVVQYRAKAGVQRAIVRAMRERTRRAGALLIVNDDLEAAMEADGWHAGQDDLIGRDLAAVRARLEGRLFGVSCGVPGEAVVAVAAGADYVGTGPFARTATKGDAGDPIGIAGVSAVMKAVAVPVVAIGGIGLAELAAVRASGAAMAAVISAIAGARDPEARTRDLVRAWERLG